MSNRETKLCREILRLAGATLAHHPSSAVVLELLASAIELGTTDSLALAAIEHSEEQLSKSRSEINRTLAGIRRAPRDSRPSAN